VIARDDYIAKIRAAADAKTSADFLLIARTDARAMLGLDEAVARANAALEAGAHQMIEAFRPSPHIFNLGHGITPQTPPENLAALIDIIKRK